MPRCPVCQWPLSDVDGACPRHGAPSAADASAVPTAIPEPVIAGALRDVGQRLPATAPPLATPADEVDRASAIMRRLCIGLVTSVREGRLLSARATVKGLENWLQCADRAVRELEFAAAPDRHGRVAP